MITFVWICTFFLNLLSICEGQDACSLSFNFPTKQMPLLLTAESRKISGDSQLRTDLESYLLYPDRLDSSTQRLPVPGSGIHTVACPGNRNHILNFSNNKIAEVSCSKRSLLVNGQEHKTSEPLGCKGQPEETIKPTNEKCHGDREGVLHVIGWQIEPSWFVPQITVCWDPVKETTIYTRHVIYGSSLGKQLISPGRPSFKVGTGLFSKRIIQLYAKESQLAKLRPLLGDVKIPGSGTYFFARGHLAPDADFILPTEQDSTYFYANVVPQFQSLNNGNWKSVENSIRSLAEKRKHSFVVYTGTMGTLKLKDETGNPVAIYLDPAKELYPAPLIVWKVIHDPVANEAVAILGLNFVQKDNAILSSFFGLCSDVCSTLKWSSREYKDWKKGSILCCTWDQFKKLVPKMVNIKNVKLLNK